MPAPVPVFETKVIADRKIVFCTLGDYVGSARVFTAGVAEAEQRAERQARDKMEKAGEPL